MNYKWNTRIKERRQERKKHTDTQRETNNVKFMRVQTKYDYEITDNIAWGAMEE